MDTIAHHLRHVSDRIRVPRSVPGLANKRLLVRLSILALSTILFGFLLRCVQFGFGSACIRADETIRADEAVLPASLSAVHLLLQIAPLVLHAQQSVTS